MRKFVPFSEEIFRVLVADERKEVFKARFTEVFGAEAELAFQKLDLKRHFGLKLSEFMNSIEVLGCPETKFPEHPEPRPQIEEKPSGEET